MWLTLATRMLAYMVLTGVFVLLLWPWEEHVLTRLLMQTNDGHPLFWPATWSQAQTGSISYSHVDESEWLLFWATDFWDSLLYRINMGIGDWYNHQCQSLCLLSTLGPKLLLSGSTPRLTMPTSLFIYSVPLHATLALSYSFFFFLLLSEGTCHLPHGFPPFVIVLWALKRPDCS